MLIDIKKYVLTHYFDKAVGYLNTNHWNVIDVETRNVNSLELFTKLYKAKYILSERPFLVEFVWH